MILHNLINEHLHSATSKLILYSILERAEYEKKTVIKMEQTYISELCCTTKQTVCNELKYLANEGYITYQRSIFQANGKKLTTTEITLTEKSVSLININNNTEKQNKAQISTKTNHTNKDIVKEKKIAEKANKQSITEDNKQVCNNNSIEELKNEYQKLNRIQRDCLSVIRKCTDDSYMTLYINDARDNMVPEQLIQYTLSIRQ